MAILARPAVARQMLDHRQHAACEESLDQRLTEESDQPRIRGKRAIADCPGLARQRQVEHRRAHHVDAKRQKIARDQSGV